MNIENFDELKQNKDEKKSKYHIVKIIMTVVLGFLTFIAGSSAFFFICINGFSMDGSTAHTAIPAIISVVMTIGFTASILLIWNKFPNIKEVKIDSHKIKNAAIFIACFIIGWIMMAIVFPTIAYFISQL